ncbi:hypothetical protein HPP92_028686 [Vanilla planifolia]|uniref:Uncharacterized protein n=1 Tax=Vanilla planifolia TaxID=51239 RepID=A0A835U5F4_VANPL|nr:hypothetical protein HPP92_028686 [Vanilla planifolia]KAG0446786.1 hypothetical protein HPP92_028670 [Vanilla planifolia]
MTRLSSNSLPLCEQTCLCLLPLTTGAGPPCWSFGFHLANSCISPSSVLSSPDHHNFSSSVLLNDASPFGLHLLFSWTVVYKFAVPPPVFSFPLLSHSYDLDLIYRFWTDLCTAPWKGTRRNKQNKALWCKNGRPLLNKVLRSCQGSNVIGIKTQQNKEDAVDRGKVCGRAGRGLAGWTQQLETDSGGWSGYQATYYSLHDTQLGTVRIKLHGAP